MSTDRPIARHAQPPRQPRNREVAVAEHLPAGNRTTRAPWAASSPRTPPQRGGPSPGAMMRNPSLHAALAADLFHLEQRQRASVVERAPRTSGTGAAWPSPPLLPPLPLLPARAPAPAAAAPAPVHAPGPAARRMAALMAEPATNLFATPVANPRPPQPTDLRLGAPFRQSTGPFGLTASPSRLQHNDIDHAPPLHLPALTTLAHLDLRGPALAAEAGSGLHLAALRRLDGRAHGPPTERRNYGPLGHNGRVRSTDPRDHDFSGSDHASEVSSDDGSDDGYLPAPPRDICGR